MKPSRRARFRYMVDGLTSEGLNHLEYNLLKLPRPALSWASRFIIGLAWLTTLGAVLLLLSFWPYQPGDILIAVAGGYALAFNVVQARRAINRSFV